MSRNKDGVVAILYTELKKFNTQKIDIVPLCTILEGYSFVKTAPYHQYHHNYNKIKNSFNLLFGKWKSTTFGEYVISLHISGELEREQFWTDIATFSDEDDPRAEYRIMFHNILSAHIDSDRSKHIATQMEIGCYNECIRKCVNSEDAIQRRWESELFVYVYSERCATVYSNLDPQAAAVTQYKSTLLQNIIDGSIQPIDVGTMSADELCPNASQNERAEIELRSCQKVKTNSSKLYKCRNCGAKDCDTHERQMRASDEPADIFITCNVCSCRFKL